MGEVTRIAYGLVANGAPFHIRLFQNIATYLGFNVSIGWVWRSAGLSYRSTAATRDKSSSLMTSKSVS
eukprot:5106173-Amphidinium_carterae.1